MKASVIFSFIVQTSISFGFFFELNYPRLEGNELKETTPIQELELLPSPRRGCSQEEEEDNTVKLFARLKKFVWKHLNEKSKILKK